MKNHLEAISAEALAMIDEKKRLDAMEDNARKNIVSATDEDLSLPSAQTKISDARLALQLVAARRSKLSPPYSLVHQRLQAEFGAEIQEWNRRVEELRAAKEREIVAALLPFWSGNEPFMRRTMGASLHAHPVFHQYRQATFSRPTYQPPEQGDLVRDVKGFLAHRALHAKALGLD